MSDDPQEHGLTARQVADRLGVELATVYAYASRGTLRRRPGPDGRTSRYDPDEVEALARRARPRSARRTVGAVDVVIGTTISEIGDGWIRYRDHDLIDLVGRFRFEDVAHLLWTGDLPADAATDGASSLARPPDRAASRAVTRAVTRAVGGLPATAPVTTRLAVAAAAASPHLPAVDPADGVATVGPLLIDALVGALTPLQDDRADGSVAERLWVRCSPRRATTARVDALDRAMTLLAEHELATSTLAVRVAASTRAAPAEAILAGLGTVSGPLHGRAAVAVHQRLSGAAGTDPEWLVAGTGHSVHVNGDPRYAVLAAAVGEVATARQLEVIRADLRRLRRAATRHPNVDLALGALGFVAGAPVGATEAVFAIARTAGWLAHAHEEADEAPLRYRGRTLYRGPR